MVATRPSCDGEALCEELRARCLADLTRSAPEQGRQEFIKWKIFNNTVLEGPVPEPGKTRNVRRASMIICTNNEITIHPLCSLPCDSSTASPKASSPQTAI